MTNDDLTIAILEDIRTEAKATNARLDETNARLEALDVRVNGRIDELSKRIVESEIRTSTAIADLAGTVREMTSVLRAANDLRPRIERCERDIAELQRRVD